MNSAHPADLNASERNVADRNADRNVADHDDFGGLARDLPRLFSRRHALKALTGLGLATLAACSGSSSKDTTAETSGAASGTESTGAETSAAAAETSAAAAETSAAAALADSASCDIIPAETGGPFPGDGSNGPNVLSMDGVVRSDIRTSIGSASGTAEGVSLILKLNITSAAAGCGPFAGAAVYAWHADRDGNYSMYSEAVVNENYLRGVQVAGADGVVTFQTIFPGCYDGRWPHIHFEVYQDEASALSGGSPLATSQVAFPEDSCNAAYAATGYETSVSNLTGVTLASDNVFGDDGGARQLAKVTGDVAGGFTATLAVPV